MTNNTKKYEETSLVIANTMLEVISDAIHTSYRKRAVFLEVYDHLYNMVKYKDRLFKLMKEDPCFYDLYTKIRDCFTRSINENKDNEEKSLKIQGLFTVIGYLFQALKDEARYYNLEIDLTEDEENKNEFAHG